MIKKITSPFRSYVGNIIFALFVTWFYVVGVLFITMPLITFSEAATPETWKTILHFALISPGLLYFMVVISYNFQYVTSFRSILFPLMVLSIPAWGILTLIGIGAAVLWFVLFLMPFWIIGTPIAIIFGLILDLRKKKVVQ